jgi:hypothetical protein
MPLLSARIDLLRTASPILSAPSTTPTALIASANSSAAALVNLLTSTLPAHFDDTTTYHSRPIHLQKRAQILVADLWACFNGHETSPGHFTDIDSALTMFADYRVPQMLQRLGCLWYSPRLEGKIRRREILHAGEPMEVELRACSVWCVELLRREMVRRGWGSWEVNVEPCDEVETVDGAPEENGQSPLSNNNNLSDTGTTQATSSPEPAPTHTTAPFPVTQPHPNTNSTITPSPKAPSPTRRQTRTITLNAILLDYLLYDTAKELEAAETPTSHSPPNGVALPSSSSSSSSSSSPNLTNGAAPAGGQQVLAGVASLATKKRNDPDGPRTLPHHRTRGIWY